MNSQKSNESIFVVKSRKGYRARQSLMTAAMDIAGEHGFAALNVRKVCEHAGIGRASFYNYFGSVDDLASAVIENVQTDIENALSDNHGNTQRGVARMTACLEMLMERLRKDQRLCRFATQLMIQSESARNQFQAAVRPEIEAGMNAGDFHLSGKEIDPYLNLIMSTVFFVPKKRSKTQSGIAIDLILRAGSISRAD